MLENSRSPTGQADEALIEAFRAGDNNALDTLLERYQKILYCFILSFSRIKKDIEDILQEILLTILREIKTNKDFIPKEPGTFRKWAYTVAKHHCLKASEKLKSQFKPASQVYPDEPTGLPDDLMPDLSRDIVDYGYLEYKLSQVMPELSLEEQKLMCLFSQHHGTKDTYKKIKEHPWFSKYSLDYLKHKVHNIRERLRKKKEGNI